MGVITKANSIPSLSSDKKDLADQIEQWIASVVVNKTWEEIASAFSERGDAYGAFLEQIMLENAEVQRGIFAQIMRNDQITKAMKRMLTYWLTALGEINA